MSGHPLEWRVEHLEHGLADALDRLEALTATGRDVGAVTAGYADHLDPASAVTGRAWSLWGVPPGDRPAHLGWLTDWVDWLNDVYAAYPGQRIPPCWRQHPGLAAELLTLNHTWRTAFLDARSPEAAQTWHDYQLPALQGRLTHYLHPDCPAGQHTDPAEAGAASPGYSGGREVHVDPPGLDEWIGWLNNTYGTTLTRRVPTCWAQHAALAAELTTLHRSWQAAHHNGTAVEGAQAWHSSDLPGLLARLPAYLHPRCQHGEHRDQAVGITAWSTWTPAAGDQADAARLLSWVSWLNNTYGTAAATGHIPTCWAQHPGLVAELLTLQYTWQAAFADGATPDAAQAWHDRALPGLLGRVQQYLHRDCLTGQHHPHRPAPNGN